jgi:hypothetical protein
VAAGADVELKQEVERLKAELEKAKKKSKDGDVCFTPLLALARVCSLAHIQSPSPMQDSDSDSGSDSDSDSDDDSDSDEDEGGGGKKAKKLRRKVAELKMVEKFIHLAGVPSHRGARSFARLAFSCVVTY